MSNSVKILWGYEASTAQSSHRIPIYTDFSKVVNPHMAITGDSGSGKTHTIRHAIREVAASSSTPVRFHVFDVHGDIEVDNASTVEFSEISPYGFNPIRVDPNPKTGGVRKTIENFIETLSLSPTHSRALGPKQRAILIALCMDTLNYAGFYEDDPRSWLVKDVPEPKNLVRERIYLNIPYEEKDIAKNMARACGVRLEFDRENSCWYVDEHRDDLLKWPKKQWGRFVPSLSSLAEYAARRRAMSFRALVGMKRSCWIRCTSVLRRCSANCVSPGDLTSIVAWIRRRPPKRVRR